ncbi:tRNA pseudouridine(55) synthase TruB [Novosphingobium sp.]|uniref:tRNA pseudouridine(55) synthase TruB n=1 Tax=Novosphingobium sp. TaxID=1874826 RepID=UPI0038621A9E
MPAPSPGFEHLPNGWIILDKPLGLGSTQGVAAVKRVCREAGLGKVKVGHGGTLDPLATGVLPIALGEATKLTGRMLDGDKVYEFTIQFGAETDTLDLEGEVVATSDVRPTLAQVEAILPRFTGPIEQVPPAYSALKVGGERAYDLARKGEAVELAARSVTVFSLVIQSSPSLPRGGGSRAATDGGAATSAPFTTPAARPPSPSKLGEDCVTLTAHVSKGTYIRSLARDVALALGTVGHVTMLRRTMAGPFDLSQAISLDKLNEVGKGAPLEHILLPFEAGLDDIPALNLDPEAARAVRQGRVLTGMTQGDGLYLAREGNIPLALVELSGGNVCVVRGFNF